MKEQLKTRIAGKSRLYIGSLSLAAAGMISAACAEYDTDGSLPAAVSTQKPTPTSGIPELSGHPVSLSLPWVDKDLWYLIQGLHTVGYAKGVKNALTFAPPEIANCPGSLPQTNRYAASMAPGEVILVGDENNPADSNHSIVAIRLPDGTIVGYMHLAKIRVKVGDKINAGVALGNPSCEAPPGFLPDQIGVTIFIMDRHGRPKSLESLLISGWRPEIGFEGEGTFTDSMRQRTANLGRCGPSPESVGVCGGIKKNYLEGPGYQKNAD